MKIQEITAREICDSYGIVTIECIIILDNEIKVSAFTGQHLIETQTISEECNKSHVQKSINIINNSIAPFLVGKEPNIIKIDQLLLELDKILNTNLISFNILLVVSTAICKAQAIMENIPLYVLIASLCEIEQISIPFGLFDIAAMCNNAANNTYRQEIMIMPVGMHTFKEAIHVATTFFESFKNYLKEKGIKNALSDKGGFLIDCITIKQVLDIFMQLLERDGLQESVLLCINMAAPYFYDIEKQLYTLDNKEISSYQLVEWYHQLAKQYPLYALQNGLSKLDWQANNYFTEIFGNSLQIITDDAITINSYLTLEDIEQKVGNAIIIKPDQFQTITQMLQAIKYAQECNFAIIISHSKSQSKDTFIADLAVGCNASQIKAGDYLQGEHKATYNRLLQIEEELLLGA